MTKSITLFVLAIIKKDNKFLLTKRLEIDAEDPKEFQGMYQLPGGGVNFGETIETAIKREIKEETRLDIKVISVVPYVINSIRKKWHGVGIVLNCELTDTKQKIKLNEESNDCGWFTFEEIMNLEVLPSGKEAIKVVNARNF